MKRNVSLLLCLVLCVSFVGTCLAEDEARLAVNLQAIRSHLDAEGYNYNYTEDSDLFSLTFSLDATLDTCKVWIVGYDDGVQIQADYAVNAKSEKRDEMAKFLILVSERLRLGSFYMDYESGLIGYDLMLYTEEVAPTQSALDYGVSLAVNMTEKYADGVASILYGNATAEEAYAQYAD